MVIKCTNLNDLEAYGLVSILAAYKVFFTKWSTTFDLKKIIRFFL
jgi:hypothetical protein